MDKSREYGDFDPSAFKAPEDSEPKEKPSLLKERLKKAVLKTAAFSVIFGGNMAGYAQTRSTETRARIVPVAAEKAEKSQADRKVTIAEIRAGIRTDKQERVFVNTDADGENEMVEISGGSASSTLVNYDQIEQTLSKKDRKISKMKITHSHPLSSMGMSEVDQKPYQEGIREIPPHPPSPDDFTMQKKFQDKYGARGIKVEGEVIDAGGTWSFSVSSESKAIKDLMKMRDEAESFKTRLPEEQRSMLDQIINEGTVDPRMIGEHLRSVTPEEDPTGEKRKLGAALMEMQLGMSMRYAEAMEIYGKIEAHGESVVLAETAKDRADAIAKYVSICKQNGISVSYNPLKK